MKFNKDNLIVAKSIIDEMFDQMSRGKQLVFQVEVNGVLAMLDDAKRFAPDQIRIIENPRNYHEEGDGC